MAISKIDLSAQIRKWLSARKGKEVRGASVEAFEKIQLSVNSAIDGIEQTAVDVAGVATRADKAVSDANAATARANDTLDHADDVLKDAAQQSDHAADSAVLAESWANGGTGVRQDEGTNNSEYHSNQSRTSAETARINADRAAKYSQIVEPGFYFDPSTASLYMKTGVGVDFKAVDARLYWKILAS